jgi:tetratricopeptide (TPR) repeat protein
MSLALVAALQAVATVPQNAPVPATENLTAAEARYRSAIAINPSIAAFHESLALVLEREGATAEALAEHEKAVALDSISPRNQVGLGSLLRKLNRPADAVPHLRAALAADPNQVPVWLELSQALNAAGQHAEAAAVLDSARTIAPDDSGVAAALRELGAAAPVGPGYHDLSGFADDDHQSRWVRNAIENVFAVVLGIASLALLAPIAGALLALVVEMPRQWLARRHA